MKIPERNILKQNNYSDLSGDIVESFNLDLASNYGAIRTTRTKKVIDNTVSTDIALPVGFAFYNNAYWFITDDFIYKGGDAPSDNFTLQTVGSPPNAISESHSDIELFNGSMYISQSTTIAKLNNTTWSTAVSTELTADRPHLLKAFGSGGNARLYVTDDYDKVHSINTSDAIAATGSFTMDLKLGSDWSITMLEVAENALWIGVLNTNDGTGLVFEWDGATENVFNRRFVLEAGVVAGTVLNNTPFIMDTRGRLMRYNGAAFVEEDRLFLKLESALNGVTIKDNLRYIHPNGMAVTDYGSILIGVNNRLASNLGNEDTVPSGVYEYIPGIGLYHKYSVSTSAIGSVSYTDYGHHRVVQMGAVFFRRPPSPTSTDNGNVLFGAEYYTDTTTQRYGVFTNDTLDTTPKSGYLVTRKMFSDNIEENWNKIYGVYKEMTAESDKIVVKYRTREKNSNAYDFIWVSSTQFTTTETDTSINVDDEIKVLTGTGAGVSLKVIGVETSESVTTVSVQENPTNVTGRFSGLVTNFIKAGEMKLGQYSPVTISSGNTSPWLQTKVELYHTGEQELYKLEVKSKPTIKE